MIETRFINRLDQGILKLNKEGVILLVNDYFLEHTRYDILCGKNIDEILWREDALQFKLAEGDEKYFSIKDQKGRKVLICADILADEDTFWVIINNWKKVTGYERELETILDNIPYAIWMEDFNGNYIYANQPYASETSALLDLSMSKEKIVGLNAAELWRDKFDRQVWKQDVTKVANEEKVYEYRYLKGDDCLLPYMITKIPIKNEEGEIVKIACIKDNRAQRKVVEERFVGDYSKKKEYEIRHLLMQDGDPFNEMEYKQENNCHFLGAESLILLEYDQKEKMLKVVSKLSKDSIDIERFDKLKIEESTYKKSFGCYKIWEKDTYIRRSTLVDLSVLFKGNTKYVSQYPIKYENQLLGVVVACYRDDTRFNILNNEELRILSNDLAVIFKNIKLVEQVERELWKRKEVEKQLEDFYGTTTSLYSVYDYKKEERIVAIGWDELLGWREEKDYAVDHVIHEADRADVNERLLRVREENSVEEGVSRFLCTNGSYKWIKWKTKLTKDGNGYVMCGRDVTDEINIADERNAFQKALELESSKSEFVANMSHELKTPINILYGTLQLMEVSHRSKENNKEDFSIEKAQKYQRIMKQNVFRLLRLVNNIIDITRIGAGGYRPNLQNCNFVSIVEEITLSVVEYVQGKQLSITFDTEVEEVEMACDVEKIERIMLNLLSNAVKYSKENGEILVYISATDDHVILKVQDNGIGIAKEKQKNIFDRFVQADYTYTRRCEGSGIGLALVKSLVEMHQGTIELESELDVGTTFTISLPIILLTEEQESDSMKKAPTGNSKVEKCCIEFSDIYDLNG